MPNKKPADKIKGFGDLKAESDGDEDESNEYYTGGEKSGMVCNLFALWTSSCLLHSHR